MAIPFLSNISGKKATFTDKVIAGSGDGSVALTVNDGGGNANLTFNHADETPDKSGNSFRIRANVDSSSSPAMLFEMASGVTADTSVSTSERFRIDNSGAKVRVSSGGIMDLQRDDTSVVGNNVLGKLRFMADDPANGSFNIGAEIKAKAEAAWATDNYSSRLEFFTTTTDTSILALTIDKDQDATFAGNVSLTGGTSKKLSITASQHDTNIANTSTLELGFGHSGGTGIGNIVLTEDANNSFGADMTFGVPHNNGSGGSSTRTALTLDGGTLSAIFAGSITGVNASFDSTTAFSLTSKAGDTIMVGDDTAGSAVGNVGGSIGFSGPQTGAQRQAAIGALRTGDNHDHIGLAFYTHPSTTNDETIVKQLQINHDGTATFTGNINGSGYIQAFGLLYLRSSVQIMNKAADGFLTLASRDTSGSEVVYNIGNVGTLTAAGEIEGGSLDINGAADISDVLTMSKSNGSLIATSNTTDAFGYNSTAGKGHYIRGTASTYIYGGGKFWDGSTLHTLLHDGSTISTSQITNLSGTNTGDQTLTSLGAAPASHNHDDRYYTETETDARFTSTNGTENDYTFKIGDEGNLSGNKWYHVATTGSGNGGLHIRGFMSNHVESFASQKFDLAIQVREGNDGGQLEITGSLDVLHNATSGTDRAGIRVIKSAENGTYDEFKVYIRTCRYSMVTLRLTEEGNFSFNTNQSSPLTSEPAPVSGGHVEIDTSTTVEGNYVVDNSTIREIYHEGHLPTLSELGAQAAGTYLTDLTGAVLTTGNQTIAGVKQFNDYINASANIQMTGHLYNTNDNNSIDLIDHGNYTWFRNNSYGWVFQGGSGGDDWTRTFRFTLEGVGSGFNDKLMIIGQQQNNGTDGGKYKGVRIVKSTGSSSVVDGYLQAGDVVITGDLTVSGTTQTINQTNLDVSDNIIGLNRGATSNANDSGFIIERGSTGDNAAILWDESIDTFVFGTTTAVPSDTGNVALSAFMPIKTGSLEVNGNLTINEFLYHNGDTNTHVQMTTGKLLIKNSGGSYINLHDNGINYHQASQHTFYNKIVCDSTITADRGFTSHNQRGVATNPHTTEEYPLGHYTGGKEIWSLDPTWSDAQLKEYFNSNNVEWFEDSTAPAGYSIKITGAVNTGGYYGSGFPYIPIEDGSIYLIEVYIRNTSGSVISHYMGTQDFNHAFGSPSSGGGNPGSYGYHLMANHNPGTDWEHQYAFVSGNHNSDAGKFETGAKYFTPHSLFNYSHTSGTRECYISGWRVTRIAEQEFFASGTAAKPAIVLHDGVYSSVPNSGLYREWYDGSTATKDQVSVSTDGTRRLRINEAGVWTDQNFYVGGDWRTFSSTWDASAGTSGAGFRFHNTHSDTNGVVALTVSATGNAVFAGEVEAASLDINGEANISDHLVVKGTTSQPLTSIFPGSLVIQGGNDEDPLIAVTDVNETNAAAAVFHQSSVSPAFPALVINAASNGSEQPIISARTNVNNTTGVGGTEVFAVDGDGDATFAGTINSGAITSSGNIEHAGLTMTSGTDVDQIYEPTGMTFQLTANTWTDTGIEGDDMPTGVYTMHVYVSDFTVGGNHYYENYAATISWYGGSTNSSKFDEIAVHRSGHAPNNGDVQFRTLRGLSGILKLQVKHNLGYSAPLNNSDGGKIMRFKFRRLI